MKSSAGEIFFIDFIDYRGHRSLIAVLMSSYFPNAIRVAVRARSDLHGDARVRVIATAYVVRER
jgi:hypothetical protein